MFHLLFYLNKLLGGFSNELSTLNEKNPIKINEESNIKEEKIEKLLYESFIPLESLLFLIEVNSLNDDSTKYLIEHTVIPMKNYILSYKGSIQDALREFGAFGPKIIVKDKGLKLSLELRNSYFESDISQIAKTLYKVKNENVNVGEIDLKNFKEKYRNLDNKYIKMVLALRKSIVESDNLVSALKRERKEFIKSFAEKREFTKEEILEIKIHLNLAGSIFAPDLLLKIVGQIMLQNKMEFIQKNVSKMIKPIEELCEMIKHMSRVSKKDEIIKFLKACLVRNDWIFKDLLDDAFKARSRILESFLLPEKEEIVIEKEKALDKYQENVIKELIRNIEDLPENIFDKFLVINAEIQKDYLNLLISGQKQEEENLKKKFEEYS
ncbi:hypothetical protein H312_01955 [Anncaliia algerae PRA339]|uniref:Uncharacterized protein n=1 Tax=Anncaliia algerae PRA339 TaxID=1288291 RepID=A0A059F0W9_9MICR|nr:hypothetical protein H312_01955 [Anncaliia algerae PRA339]